MFVSENGKQKCFLVLRDTLLFGLGANEWKVPAPMPEAVHERVAQALPPRRRSRLTSGIRCSSYPSRAPRSTRRWTPCWGAPS